MKMIKNVITAALLLAAAMPALGEASTGAAMAASAGAQADATLTAKDDFTVEQALDVLRGMRGLSVVTDPDKEGRGAGVPIFKFDPDTLLLIALNIDIGKRLESRVATANNVLVMERSGGAADVPADKRGEFGIKQRELMESPSRVEFYHINSIDLCLQKISDTKCRVANDIPASVLGLFIKIVDRGPKK